MGTDDDCLNGDQADDAERWPLRHKVRIAILKRLCRIVDDEDWGGASLRDINSACRVILQADRLNLERLKHEHATRPEEKVAPDQDFIFDLTPCDPPQ